MEKVIIVSGGFDPLHSGHISYLTEASKLGDYLIIALNSDQWLKNKKSKFFLPFEERKSILENLKMVDEVFLSIDQDKTVCKSLEKIRPDIFANGGDRSTEEVPETVICNKHKIKMIDGLGEKIRSSSDLTGLKQIK